MSSTPSMWALAVGFVAASVSVTGGEVADGWGDPHGSPLAVDTLLPVTRGDMLRLMRVQGDVVIETWDGDAVRITDDEDPGESHLGFSREGRVWTVRWREGSSDVVVQVPNWLPVALEGLEIDATVRGLRSSFSANFVGGDLGLFDLDGVTTVASTHGEITTTDGRGVLTVRSSDEVAVRRHEGQVTVETTYGDVTLEAVTSGLLTVATTDGDVTFTGPLLPEGVYAMTSHSGDLWLGLTGAGGGTFNVVTFEGDLETDTPVRMQGFSSESANQFTVGDGSAQVVLQTFSGDVRVGRARE